MILEDRLTEEGMDAVFVKMEKSGFFKRLQQRLLKKQMNRKVSAQVALFWFSKDYSGIEDIKGEVQVNWNDIDKNRTVLPNGTHRSYKGIKFRELPRGRVELNNGRFTITVGDQCPKEAVDLVILAFGLNSYKAYLDKIKHKSFWNSL